MIDGHIDGRAVPRYNATTVAGVGHVQRITFNYRNARRRTAVVTGLKEKFTEINFKH